MEKKKLLVVDDNEDVRQATRRAFGRDFEIFEAADQNEALLIYDTKSPDLVFLDIDLNGLPRGWDILQRIRERGRRAVVLLVTGLATAERHPLFSQADGHFPKPFDLKSMRSFLAEKGLAPCQNHTPAG